MTLSDFLADVFLPIIDFVFSMFDQCFQMFFNLKLFGISFGVFCITIFFVKFIFSLVVGDGQDIVNKISRNRVEKQVKGQEDNVTHKSRVYVSSKPRRK